MKSFDQSFIEILKDIMENGDKKPCRVESAGLTHSVFNRILECGDSAGFNGLPISQLRKIHYKGAIIEMLWILGLHHNDERYRDLPLTNVKYLNDHGVKYWNPWADENGNLGPVYGAQMSTWPKSDGTFIHQIKNIIEKLRTDPNDRRLVASMWNPGAIPEMVLPPCHYAVEFYSRNTEGRPVLDTRWIQRSCDMVVGIPYNAIMYTVLNKIVAACTGHVPGVVTGCLGNCHVYGNQVEEANELIKRFYSEDFKNIVEKKPHFSFSDRIIEQIYNNKMCELEDFAIDGSDFKVDYYESLPELKVAINV